MDHHRQRPRSGTASTRDRPAARRDPQPERPPHRDGGGAAARRGPGPRLRQRRRRAVARPPGMAGHRRRHLGRGGRTAHRLARSHGLSDHVTRMRADLHESFPPGAFDLICAHYLHTPSTWTGRAVLRSAAYALRPGGRLLVVDHGSTAPWSWNQDPAIRPPDPARSRRGHRPGPPRRGRSSGPTRPAGSRPDRTGAPPRSPTTSSSSAAPPDPALGSAEKDTTCPARPAATAATTPRRPGPGATRAEVLRGFLDYLRSSIAAKVEGAPEPQVRAAAVPSGTNLLGLLHHLTFVERSMFLGDRGHRLAGDVPRRTGGQRGRCRRPLPETTVNARERRPRRLHRSRRPGPPAAAGPSRSHASAGHSPT